MQKNYVSAVIIPAQCHCCSYSAVDVVRMFTLIPLYVSNLVYVACLQGGSKTKPLATASQKCAI